ncbi:hypothetical protein [Sorangium sp. So ce1335]|uniref:hypothetical protein n=1 Tax=Sorangium sp. So ce1335 TaxID=3133335 RepID=UPI003F62F6AE
MAWGDNETYYDEIEWNHIDWLRANLPSYIKFHAESKGHLPENFVDTGGNRPLAKADAVAGYIRRTGYLSYSIFVNVLLAKEALDLPSEGETMLRVYSRVSSFFLRAGAVIDISKELWNTTQWDRNTKKVKGLAGPAKVLKTTLDPIDAFNNFTKHGGLAPAGLLRAEFDGKAGHIVLLPKELSRSAQDWSEHPEPDQDADALLATYFKKLVSEIDKFYDALVKDNARRLRCWRTTTVAAPKGIRDFVDVQADGYVVSSGSYGR